jgi:hypothetical protein
MAVIHRFQHSRHCKNNSHFNDDYDMPASLHKKFFPVIPYVKKAFLRIWQCSRWSRNTSNLPFTEPEVSLLCFTGTLHWFPCWSRQPRLHPLALFLGDPFWRFSNLSPTTPWSPKCSDLFRYSDENSVCLSHVSGGHAIAYLVEALHYATSRKVAGSIHDEVDFFNLPNPSSLTVVLRSTQPLNEYQDSSWG